MAEPSIAVATAGTVPPSADAAAPPTWRTGRPVSHRLFLLGEGIGASKTPGLHEAEARAQGIWLSYRCLDSLTWGITLNDSGVLVGTIGFYRLQLDHHRGEIGYLLHPEHWGKGIASEAFVAAVDHGFQVLRFHSIEAVTDPENHASNKLLERAGFILEAHFRENYLRNGKFLDSLVWSKLTPRSA